MTKDIGRRARLKEVEKGKPARGRSARGNASTRQRQAHSLPHAVVLKTLLEGAREGAAVLDGDRQILYANDRLAEMLRLDCAAVVGKPFAEFVAPGDRDTVERLMQPTAEQVSKHNLHLTGENAFPLPVELSVRQARANGNSAWCILAVDLSRRRRAEEQLAFQAHLLANVSDAVLAMDTEYRITSWNAAAERLYGHTAEEVLGRSAIDVVGVKLDEAERTLAGRQLVETGRSQNQLVHHRRDGTPIKVESTTVAIRAEDGRLVGYVSVGRDITERQRAQELTRQHAARAEALTRAAALPNAQLDLPTLLQTICQEAARALNAVGAWINLYNAERAVLDYAVSFGLPAEFGERYRSPARVLYEEYAARVSPLVFPDVQVLREIPNAELYAALDVRTIANATLQREHELIGVLSVPTFGEIRQFTEDDLALLRGLADQAAQAIVNARLHAQVQENAKALAQQAAHLQEQADLLELAPDGIFARDLNSRIVYWNHGAETLYGWPRAQALGQISHALLQTEFPQPLDQIERQILTEGRWEGELVHTTLDGRRLIVESRWAWQRDGQGQPSAILEINTDITERKKIEDRIRHLNTELEQRVEARTRELDAERARWQGVVEGIADEVWVADAEGKLSLINLPEVTALGLREFTDKTIAEVYEEVDILNPDGQMRPLEQAPLLRALRGEIVRGEEILRHRQTGRTRYRQFSAAPMRDATGRIAGAVAIVRDITDLKMAQAEIESLARFPAENPDPILRLSAEGVILYANDASAEILQEWGAALGGTAGQFWQETVTQALASGQRHTVDCDVKDQIYSILVVPVASAGYVNLYGRNITARRRAEAALAEREELFRLALTVGQAGAWGWDLTTNAVQWSDEYYRLFGFEPGSLPPSPEASMSRVHPEDRAAVEGMVRAAIERGTPIDHVRRVVWLDGTVHWVRCVAQTFLDDQDRPQRLAGLAMDITELKRAEQALRESEERYRALFESALDAIIVTDPSGPGTVLSANPAACRLFGYSEQEFLQLDGAAMVDTRDPNLTALLKRREETGQAMGELVYRRKDGTRFAGELTSVTFQDRNGERRAVAIIRDVTERKRADESLRQTLLALRESQDRYHLLFDQSPLPKWVLDLESFAILEVNDAAVRLYGYTREDFLRLTLQDIRPPEEFAKFMRWLEEGRAKGTPLGRTQTKHRKKDGALIEVEVHHENIVYQDRRALLAVMVDTTERNRGDRERRQLQRDVEQRAAELEIANRELEAFSYSVSHDLRAPLGVIDGFSRALLEDYGLQLAEDGQRFVRMIQQNALAMNRLIDDLLMFSRTTRQPLTRQTVDMTTLVAQVVQELGDTHAGRHVEITLGDLPAAHADPTLLKQVWFNLLSNALKYTRRREAALIEIGSYQKEGETIYVVKDNGVGFDPAQAEKLFGVFQRLHSEEEYEGTGVGLAIVERVVRRHGGRVWAEAEVDRGATFYFTLGENVKDEG